MLFRPASYFSAVKEATPNPNQSGVESNINSSLRLMLRSAVFRSVTLSDLDRVKTFDQVWAMAIKRPDMDISHVNAYLQTRLESDINFDSYMILDDLQQAGIKPDVKTFGLMIEQSCSKGDMIETKKLLRLLKESQLEISGYIFSSIIFGYMKAGHPKEAEAVKEVMAKCQLWPSKSGYIGVLLGHASHGDVENFFKTLDELSAFYSNTSTDSLIHSYSCIKLYKMLALNTPDSRDNCIKMLNYFPKVLEPFSLAKARNCVLLLLQNNRPLAALELFKHCEPNNSADEYMLTITRCLRKNNEVSHVLGKFFEVAGLPPPRINLFLRRADFQNYGDKPAANLLDVQLNDKSVEDVFKCAAEVEPFLVVRKVVPHLLSLGLDPLKIVETIKPQNLAPSVAIACVANCLCPPGQLSTPLKLCLPEALALSNTFLEKNYLPTDESVAPLFTRKIYMGFNLIHTAHSTNISIQEVIDYLMQITTNCLGSNSAKALIARLIGQLYEIYQTRGARKLDSDYEALLQAIIDSCISQNIRFQEINWVLYALQQMGVENDVINNLRAEPLEMKRLDVLLTQMDQFDSAANTKDIQRLVPIQTIPTDTIADLIDFHNQSAGYSPSVNDPLFWTNLHSDGLIEPKRALECVALAFLNEQNFTGLANFIKLAFDCLGSRISPLLSEDFIKPLLLNNFDTNLSMLESILSSPSFSLYSFSIGAHALESCLASLPASYDIPSHWQSNGVDRWSVDHFERRLTPTRRMQKLKLIHDTTRALCRHGHVSAAHALTRWCKILDLIPFMKTNEFLIMSPFFQPQSFPTELPRWSLSHTLSQHFPVCLSAADFATLDSLVVNEHASTKLARWLSELSQPNYPAPQYANPSSVVPTWLVVSQRLCQLGSHFANPQSWFILVTEMLKTKHPSMAEHLHDWYTYAPSDSHRAALLLGSLLDESLHEWALGKLESNPELLYELVLVYQTIQPKDAHLTDALSTYSRKPLFDWLCSLVPATSDPALLQTILSSVQPEQMIDDVVPLLLIRPSFLEPIADFVCGHQPHLLHTLFDKLLATLRSSANASEATTSCLNLLEKYPSCLEQLDDLNRAFLHASLCLRGKTDQRLPDPMRLLENVLDLCEPVPLSATLMSTMELVQLASHLKHVDRSNRFKAASLIVYSLVSREKSNEGLEAYLNELTLVADVKLFKDVLNACRPFLPPGLIHAYYASALVNEVDRTWLDWASIRFYKPGTYYDSKDLHEDRISA